MAINEKRASEPVAQGVPALGRVTLAYVLSGCAHLALLAGAAYGFAHSWPIDRGLSAAVPRAVSSASAAEIEIELPALVDDGLLSEGVASAPSSEVRVAAPRGGGEAPARPDMNRAGRGGEALVREPAFNLADQDDGMFLTPDPPSRFDRNQLQRVESSKQRASRENYRASREPMELTFVASGKLSSRSFRTRAALVDGSSGREDRGAPRRLGAVLGANARVLGVGESPRKEGASVEGGAELKVGRGVVDGAPGDVHSEKARLSRARPMVAEGTPSVPSLVEGRPHDTVQSEQEVAGAKASLLHASTAGGDAGAGVGGEKSVSVVPASGGVTGVGSRSDALGSGQGQGLDADAADRRRNLYLRSVMAKIHPLWANAFPKWAILKGLQGMVIIGFEIRADGSVAGVRVVRPSGVSEFDENCRQAVLRAAPFGPLPVELGARFQWALPFEARNPVVRPKMP